MIRHKKLTIDYLQKLSGACKPELYDTICGVQVKISSQRYKLFKENKCCVVCGLEGKFLAIEKSEPEIKRYHINMYGINENGKEILMTKDHIIPRSKGGKDIHSNYQTMCSVCNSDKGNGDSKSLKSLFNDYVYNKTQKNIDKIDNLCFQLGVEPSDFWYYYLNNNDNFSETDFLTELLTYFYYYLSSQVENLFKENNIDIKWFWFHTVGGKVYLGDGNEHECLEEFEEKIVNADFSVKKKLMQNKIFAHLIKKAKINILTDKQTRALKLENISE